MQEYEPRIIARGEWTQDENGDTTYYPAHRRPQTFREEPAVVTGWGDLDHGRETNDALYADPDEAAPDASARGGRGGYRIRSDAVWERARAEFLGGESAAAVCDRHDLSLGAFKSRAAREGWRRRDQADPEPVDLDIEEAPGATDVRAMAEHALIRAHRAVQRGRAADAGTWLRVHRQLVRLIADDAPEADAPPPSGPDLFDAVSRRIKVVADLARTAATLSDDNAAGRAAVESLIAQLDDMPLSPAPVSDLSDSSDPGSCSGPDGAEQVSSPSLEDGEGDRAFAVEGVLQRGQPLNARARPSPSPSGDREETAGPA